MKAGLPLLRSPPFPGVPPAVAAVSAWRRVADAHPFDQDRIAALLDRIVQAGVAGDFWAGEAGASGLKALSADLAQAQEMLINRVAYRDPFTGDPASAEETVALLAFWKGELARNPGAGGGTVACLGIAAWKRPQLRQLLWSGPASAIRFAGDTQAALRIVGTRPGAILAWPSRMPADLLDAAKAANVPVYPVEDGFIRSVGLGAACHPPFSIVLDRQGMHYDPSRPSDLETLLRTREFSPALLHRAQSLIDLIVAARVSKYETGGSATLPPHGERRRILVTGQVEDDLSVRLGGGDVAGNRDLIRRARVAEPDAEIWFKPHPDVDAGLRSGALPDREALQHVDRVVRDVPMAALLDAIDGLHVLTSLAGFEALLRGVAVTTHGVPFYAGWGLTRDLGAVPARRDRVLSLPQLVAGVLLLYPHYLDPVTQLPCTPEVLIRRLSEQAKPQETWRTRLRHLQGRMRRIANELSF